ncbi:hypothetical protein ASH00_14440 [Arthrobacter sp. Soil782]|uniref:hypothetical protein n=1 Tax=Arthrobacter sp. Soil782 TaxID=1736410 RepID=UPI0006F6D465|nr:hypothetical protein [Arthrobacter sp. Soil782]KRF04300.1 hypothetical protein ASH00_14440 [Arthrobacter sp. Soil782]
MAAMRILAVNRKLTTETDVAFLFDTHAQIRAAWRWLIENDRLHSFSYRPKSEGPDLNRLFLEQYLIDYRLTKVFVPLETTTIVELVQNFYGADLDRTIYNVVNADLAVTAAATDAGPRNA